MASKKRRAARAVVHTRAADLDIFVSNRHEKPQREKCDKQVFHNSVKDRSRVTQFCFLNKDYSVD